MESLEAEVKNDSITPSRVFSLRTTENKSTKAVMQRQQLLSYKGEIRIIMRSTIRQQSKQHGASGQPMLLS